MDFDCKEFAINSVCFDNSGMVVAAGSDDGSIRM
jgi:hypothetical protein